MKDAVTYLPKKRKLLRVIGLMTAVTLLIGLLSYAGLVAIPSVLQSKPKRIIVIGKTAQIDIAFWETLKAGMDEAAKEYNVSYEYIGPPTESDADRQIQMVYEAIDQKPDAIILAATDYNRLIEPARAIRSAGIVLVTMDSNVGQDFEPIENCFVATDNVAAGEKAGKEMQSLLPAGKKVAIVSHQITTSSSKDRDKGVRMGLDKNTPILPTVDSNGSAQIAFEQVQDLLKDPDVGGVIGLNEYSTLGAARAIAASGREVLLVGFDSSQDQIEFMEQGLLKATVIQRPFNMGYVSIVKAMSLLNGDKIQPFYDTGSILITKSNMYSEENEKLLFPFL